jgi:S-adenosylmethionine synthetase
MAVRNGGHLDLTVACAMIGRFLANVNSYLEEMALRMCSSMPRLWAADSAPLVSVWAIMAFAGLREVL